jgi:hypothetical protein
MARLRILASGAITNSCIFDARLSPAGKYVGWRARPTTGVHLVSTLPIRRGTGELR